MLNLAWLLPLQMENKLCVITRLVQPVSCLCSCVQACCTQVCIKYMAEGSQSRKQVQIFELLKGDLGSNGTEVVCGGRTKWPAEHCHGVGGHNPALRGLCWGTHWAGLGHRECHEALGGCSRGGLPTAVLTG